MTGLGPVCCCDCQLCFAVACAGVAVAGATVTVKDGGGTTVGTATTDGAGNACVAVPGSDTYSYSVAKASYTTVTGSKAVTCPGTTGVAVTLCVPVLLVTNTLCNSFSLPNCSVQIFNGGTLVASGTTDVTFSSFNASVPPFVVYTVVIQTPAGYAHPCTLTVTVTPTTSPTTINADMCLFCGGHCGCYSVSP